MVFKKINHLKKDIKVRSIVYSKQEINDIYNKLLPLTQFTEEQRKEHIRSLALKNFLGR